MPTGADPRRIYMDYCFTYVVAASVIALTLGQFGDSDSDGKPNFLQQLAQRNVAGTAWAIASGICVGLGDAAMQYSIALLGLAVGPAVMNSLIVIVGEHSNPTMQQAQSCTQQLMRAIARAAQVVSCDLETIY